MPANNPFTDEEKKLFSELLMLRKSDNAHFRRAFKELGEEQVRFLEYKETLDIKAQNSATLSGEPVLNGFRLSQAPPPRASHIDSKHKKKRCILQ